MTDDTIKPGDIVRLKSGSPAMTVVLRSGQEGYEGEVVESWDVVWFQGFENGAPGQVPTSAKFAASSLVKTDG